MRLAAEIAVGAIAGAVAYYVARPAGRGAEEAEEVPEVRRRTQPAAAPAAPGVRSARVVTSPARTLEPVAIPTAGEISMLRSEIARVAVEDMGRRGKDVMACLAGVTLADALTLRFAVDVDATAEQAHLGSWRFVEIVSGEPLPDSFAPCAAEAFGAGQRVAPPPGFRFPAYRGEIAIVYRVPPPPPQ